MNANELADKLEECAKINFFIDCTYEQYDDDKDIKLEAATMLRQQQAEIEALKAQVLEWENAEVPTEVMADIIVELEKRGFIEKAQEK